MADSTAVTTRPAGALPDGIAVHGSRGAGAPAGGVLVHRPVRAHPVPVPAGDLTLAAPPPVGRAASGLAGWLQYLMPLVGGGGSVAFLFAAPGPRPVWLVALIVAAVVASVGAGLALRLLERRAARRAGRGERARYLAYLADTALRADRLAAAQLATAEHLHPDPPGLPTAVARTDRLWERRPADPDFLTVRVGRGPVPLAAPIRLDPGRDPLTEHDPELLQAAERLVRRGTWLPDAPVAVSLTGLGVLALTGPAERVRALARALVGELAAFHAPDDLRILAAYPAAFRRSWQWMGLLPHTGDPTAATGPAGLSGLTGPGEPGSAGDRPHLVVIVDATAAPPDVHRPPATPGAGFHGPILDQLLERSAGAGVTVIWLATSIAGEPSELSVRVRLDDSGWATLQETAPGGALRSGIRADTVALARCEALARQLAPLRLDRPRPTVTRAGPVRLLDLLDADPVRAGSGPGVRSCGRAELLRVPIGATTDGTPLVLDLKEAAEAGAGPHGLVVGATGSGKSELLRTIVAGLAATHPPEQLAFVLVDFKGGAAFSDLARLPQVAGLITNLGSDLSMVDRAMAALQGELARRQRLLHQAGNRPDLRAYAAARAADPRLDPLPQLLVVVDEFGELLAARPELLDLFIAIGRVGRSLGMHLLLASQRLDEGRLRGLDSHLRFRICLRTFSAAESTAVLGLPDAYHLPADPGAAILKVDAGPPVPFTVALVSTEASTARPGPSPGGVGPPDPVAGGPSDLELLRRRAETGPPAHQVWLPPLSTDVTLDRLLRARDQGWLRVPVGLVDRPLEQRQEPLVLDLSGAAGHLAVVGAPRSGKSTLLGTLVAALAATHPPDEVQVYAVDLGGGLLHRLGDLAHVGAVCGPREAERVHRVVRELRSLIVERERRFRDLGVDSMTSWHGLRRAGLDLGGYGEVFLVVDNWGALVRELPELEPAITELAALGLHHGVHLVLSANRWAELRPGLRENLGGRLELRLNDPLESELGRALATALPKLPGRGLTSSGLQFQAALPGDPDAVLDRALAGQGGAVAPPLRLLPTLVGEAALPPPGRGAPAGLPFAVEEHRLEVVRLDLFAGSPHLLVLGDAACGKSSLLRRIAKGLAARHPPDEVAVVVVDPRRRLLDLTALPNLVAYACTTTMVTRAVDHLRRRLEERMAAALDVPPGPSTAPWVPAGVGQPLLGGPGEGVGGPGPTGLAHPNGHVVGAATQGRATHPDPTHPDPTHPDPTHPDPTWPGPTHPGPTRSGLRAGPRFVVLVDDYDLLPGAAGSPLLPLLDLLGLGGELGVHVVLARRVAGAARAAFEPVFQRIRGCS
jgi:DNA segregation ATPase FtsK/SpoIIIE, S-DNA-T family